MNEKKLGMLLIKAGIAVYDGSRDKVQLLLILEALVKSLKKDTKIIKF